jgi:1-phosphofructokinase family hexose kinase
MILTVTLNPAVDKTYTTDALILGQVNRIETAQNIAGGKGVNVAKILRQCEHPVMTCGLLGGYTGLFIEDYMKNIGADCRFTKVAGETRSNINVLAGDGYVTELLEPGPEVSDEELELFVKVYEEAIKECELVVLSGSVARGIRTDIYKRLIKIGNENKKICILDTSGEALRFGIKSCPYMIKPNQKELEYLVGHKLTDIEDIADAARELCEEGIAKVVVSMGGKGLLSVSKEGVLWAKAPSVKALNTVGCGDSVVASYAMSILEGEDDFSSLKRAAATAASSAATFQSGEIALGLSKELLAKVQIEKKD